MIFTRNICFVLSMVAPLCLLFLFACTAFPLDRLPTKDTTDKRFVSFSGASQGEDDSKSLALADPVVRHRRMARRYQDQRQPLQQQQQYEERMDRLRDEQNSSASSGTMIFIVLLSVFVGIPALMCLSKKYNLFQCCCDMWQSMDDLEDDTARRRKRKSKSDRGEKEKRAARRKKREKRHKEDYDSETEFEDEDHLDDSEDSLSESRRERRGKDRKRKKRHSHDSESKSELIRKLKRLKSKAKRAEQDEREEDSAEENHRKSTERKKKKKRVSKAPVVLDLSDSTVPVTPSESGTVPLTTTATPTYTATTSTPISTPTVLPGRVRAEPASSSHGPSGEDNQNQTKSPSSEYAYVVYRPDTNYVAVSRSLKNLIPPNTTVIYKVDETSNQTEASSIMKSLKSAAGGGSMRRRFPSEPSTLTTSDSPPTAPMWKQSRAGSPSGKSLRSIRSNYFIVNSDLLLTTPKKELSRVSTASTAPTPASAQPPPTSTREMPNETVFVYSTKAQLSKMPQYQAKVQLQDIGARASGTQTAAVRPAHVRFSTQVVPDQTGDDLSEDDSEEDSEEAAASRSSRTARQHQKDRREEHRKKRASGNHRDIGGLVKDRRKSGTAAAAIRTTKRKAKEDREEKEIEKGEGREEDLSEDNSDESGDNSRTKRRQKKQHREAKRKDKRGRPSSANGARRHSSVRLAGSSARKELRANRQRHTRRHEY